MTITKIQGGATIWARQTMDSEIFSNKPDKYFKIWFYIVNKVNHQEKGQFKRGEGFFKYEWIKEKTDATQDQVKHCLKYLKGAKMIATHKSTRGMIIKVLNYDKYQNFDNYKNYKKSHSTSQTNAKQMPNTSHTINNNDENDKNATREEVVNSKNKLIKWFGEKENIRSPEAVVKSLFKKYSYKEIKRALHIANTTQGDPYRLFYGCLEEGQGGFDRKEEWKCQKEKK